MRRTTPHAANTDVQRQKHPHAAPITEADVLRVPEPMQRYLRYAQIIGKEPIQTVSLTQRGFFRTHPDQRWFPLVADEDFTTSPPAFLWHGKIRLVPGIFFSARDHFAEGHGNLQVKLCSLIPLADVHGPEADQGELLRYLGEMIWFPTAWLSEALEWQARDAYTVQVTLRQPTVSVSAVLSINDLGQMTRLTAERSMVQGRSSRLEPWSAHCQEYQEVQGMRIPTSVDVAWNLASGDFSYFRGEITAIAYNQQGKGIDRTGNDFTLLLAQERKRDHARSATP